MAHGNFNETAIKIKSETLSIPYANASLAFLMEEFLILLSQSNYAGNFWIKNYRNLHIKNYRKKPVNCLDFYYKGLKDGKANEQCLNAEVLEEIMRTLIEKEINKDIVWNYQIFPNDEDYRLEIEADLNQMQIPFRVKVKNLDDEKVEPAKIKLRSSLRNDEQIELISYPTELVLAKYLFEILEKMELINDMGIYLRFYNILEKEVLDGRKVQKQLALECQAKKLSIEKNRLEMIKNYRSYSYMKKKWRRYLKSEKKSSPDWEEIVDKVVLFLSPIWDMMCKDLIFIGDWMPEVGRFLD